MFHACMDRKETAECMVVEALPVMLENFSRCRKKAA